MFGQHTVIIITAAFVGYIYSEHLTRPGMLLNWWYHVLERLPEFFFKPLVGCFRCVCGQWAMWTYFVQSVCYGAADFNVFHMIAYGCIGVAVGIISHKYLGKDE